MKDILNAIEYFRAEPYKTVENDILKVHLSDLQVKIIELKPLGKIMVDEWVRRTNPNSMEYKLETIFGVKVVVSNEVKGFELR